MCLDTYVRGVGRGEAKGVNSSSHALEVSAMFHVLWGLPFKVHKMEKFLPNFDVLLLLTCFIFIKQKTSGRYSIFFLSSNHKH